MANRKTTFLLRRSNVIDKIPDLSGLTIGELALNTADAKLYTIYTSGTTGTTEVREIGWNRVHITGGTIIGSLDVTSSVTSNIFNATFIYDKNISLGNPGQFLSTTPTGVEWADFSGAPCSNTSTVTTNGLSFSGLTTMSGLTSGSYIIKLYVTAYNNSSNKYGFWQRTLSVFSTGDTPTITQTTEDFDSYVTGFSPSHVVFIPNSGSSIDVYVSGLTGDQIIWESFYEVKGRDCGGFGGGGSSEFTGNTSANCINDIFVKNLHSCSPLNINPNDEGNIYFGSTSGITIDLTNTSLFVSGSTSATTFYGSGSGLTNIPISGITNLNGILNNKFDTSGGTISGNITANGFNGSGSGLTGILISGVDTLGTTLNNKLDKSGGTVSGSLVVNGNFTVLGSATTVNTQTLNVADNEIILNSNLTGATDLPFFGKSGINVLRGSATTTSILWDETLGYWVGGYSGSTRRLLFSGDVTDVFVTGGTYSASSSTIIFRNNTGGTFNVTGITATGGGTFTGGTVTGATNFTNGLTANTFSSATVDTTITDTRVIYSNNGALTGSTGLTWVNSASTLTINGTLEATSKSFSIPHPTKEGKKLVYGSLEGPENGVYHRGKIYNEDTIILPEYWSKLIDVNTITVHLTPIGRNQNLYVKKILEDTVIIGIDSGLFGNKTIECYYIVYGERKDINKLETER
jgi:hypothetical protein